MTRYELVNEAGQAEPRAPGVEVNNSAIPARTSNLSANWSKGGWSATWTARYIDRLRERCAGANGFDICDESDPLVEGGGTNYLGATTYHDAQLSWGTEAWMKDFRITLGVNNVLGKDPPICLSCTLNGYDASTYDLPGSITMHWATDGDHSLKPRRASGRSEEENLADAADAVAAFVTARSR